MDFRKTFIRNIQNIPGWRTSRRIVVIESDDWGSIRMPSKEVFNHLLRKGFHVDKDPFLKYDSLASEQDLTNLMEALSSVKDCKGNSAKITLNTIMANPDFNRIRESEFKEYHFELFTETLKQYPSHQNSFRLWQEGIQKKLFLPQFHGREHLNVAQWMKAINRKDPNIIEAFNNKMISISSEPMEMKYGYMEAYDYFSEEDKWKRINIITEGLDLFEKVFGFKSKSFIGCCFVWDKEIESELFHKGVQGIQGIVRQLQPYLMNNKHKYKNIYHYIGQRNKSGQIYSVRNAFFEPCLKENIDYTNTCLREIKIAFTHHKPAIISAHRLNFIGSIDERNRDENLLKFKGLLEKILREWPDAEFMFSNELCECIL